MLPFKRQLAFYSEAKCPMTSRNVIARRYPRWFLCRRPLQRLLSVFCGSRMWIYIPVTSSETPTLFTVEKLRASRIIVSFGIDRNQIRGPTRSTTTRTKTERNAHSRKRQKTAAFAREWRFPTSSGNIYNDPTLYHLQDAAAWRLTDAARTHEEETGRGG